MRPIYVAPYEGLQGDVMEVENGDVDNWAATAGAVHSAPPTN